MRTVAWSVAALVACAIWFAVLLFSPVMGPDTFGGESSCGSVRSLIASGGETRNNGGDITGEQFDKRITQCREAYEGQVPFLAFPLGIGCVALGLTIGGAVSIAARKRALVGS